MIARYRGKGAIRMSAAEDVDRLIERFNLAQGEVVKGNAGPANGLFSYREDVTLANPLGRPAHGWDEVAAAGERAASQLRAGEIVGFETIEKYVTDELAYIVRVERARVRLAEARISLPSLLGLR